MAIVLATPEAVEGTWVERSGERGIMGERLLGIGRAEGFWVKLHILGYGVWAAMDTFEMDAFMPRQCFHVLDGYIYVQR